MKKQLKIILGFTLAIASCGKDEPKTETPSTNHSISIAGWVNPPDASPDGAFYAKLWSNGQGQQLTANQESRAMDVFVQGSDTYAAGCIQSGTSFNATYWKNGVQFTLPNAPNGSTVDCAKAVFVKDSMVYIAGGPLYSNTTGTLWVNGTASNLPGCQDAVDVTVANGSVYVAGLSTDPNSSLTTATFWKNGVRTLMGDGNTTTTANALAVSDTNVYVVGRDVDFEIARLWRNGQVMNLPGAAFYSDAMDVAVDGQNVYVLVIEEDQNTGNIRTVLYKNNTRSILSNDPSVNTEGTGLAVKDGVVYVCGLRTDNNNGTDRAVYWKNGSLVNLSDGSIDQIASGIFVR
jgi:hypothetical protein